MTVFFCERGVPRKSWGMLDLDESYRGLQCEARVKERQCKHPARGGLCGVDETAVTLCTIHARMLARHHYLPLHPRRAAGETQHLQGIPGAIRLHRQLHMEGT